MRETLKGHGKLETGERPDKQHDVEYRIEITTEIVERHGLPPVAASRHSRGNITQISGDPLPEGVYRLYAEDGEVLKVQNTGSTWVILASQ